MTSDETMRRTAELMAANNKKELIVKARSMGWRGDHARAPALQLALYIASGGATEKKQEGQGERSDDNGRGAPKPEGEQSQGAAGKGKGKGDAPQSEGG